MENKPKRSKALIITIIIVLFLLLVGYLLVKNRDVFGPKTSASIARIFSPLLSSDNQNGLNQTDENGKKVLAQAGENIKKGDSVSKTGTDANNNPIVMISGSGDEIFGFASGDITNGEFGEIITNSGGSNGFWNTFSNFLNNLFNGNGGNGGVPPAGGWVFDPNTGGWIFDPNGTGGWIYDPSTNTWVPPTGGWIYDPNTNTWTPPGGGGGNGGGGGGIFLPQCSDTKDNDTDTLVDTLDPNCHVDGDLTKAYVPTHYSESSNPGGGYNGGYLPQCNDTKDNDADTLVDTLDPNCHTDGDATNASTYVPTHYSEINSPWGGGGDITPECSDDLDNDADTLIDELDPGCHYSNNSYNPEDDSEYNSGQGDFNNSDLVASVVTPTSTTANTPTSLSATITNDGDGSTGYNFSSFFTITDMSSSNIEDEINGDTISKSGLKKVITKILNKISSLTSRVLAGGLNAEISVVTPELPSKTSSPISITYTFASAGTYYIRACADKRTSADTGTINETNEENNCGAWTTFVVTSSLPTGGETPECSDDLDNDADTLIDELDPGCHYSNNSYNPEDDNESDGSGGTVYECNDTLDNDYDGKIDEADPNCHVGGDLDNEYVENHDDESTSPIGEDNSEENKCKLIEENPLEFTPTEKARLAALLRKFYLISSTLRTADDITTIYNEIDQQKNFISQIEDLTKQCYLDTDFSDGFTKFCDRHKGSCDTNPATEFATKANDNYYDSYYGKRHDKLRGNPWFTATTNTGDFPYTAISQPNGYLDYNYLENSVDGIYGDPSSPIGQSNCKVVSGYYYGKLTREVKVMSPSLLGGWPEFKRQHVPPIGHMTNDQAWNLWISQNQGNTTIPAGGDCNELNTFSGYGDCYNMSTKITGNAGGQPFDEYLEAGCKWKDGVILNDAERILNIW